AELRKVPAGAHPAEDLAARRALADALPEVAETLGVARDRAASERARASVARLVAALDALAQATPRADRGDVLSILVGMGVEF
ncbi:hypothetical protein KQ720_15450, partial [Listeria monocytogenes]|nr:hypothetical protein [Listeria monocytogenes]